VKQLRYFRYANTENFGVKKMYFQKYMTSLNMLQIILCKPTNLGVPLYKLKKRCTISTSANTTDDDDDECTINIHTVLIFCFQSNSICFKRNALHARCT
jgi:hypothetical protein